MPNNLDTCPAQEQASQSTGDAADTAVEPTGHAGRPQLIYTGCPTRSHNKPARYLDSVAASSSLIGRIESRLCAVLGKACHCCHSECMCEPQAVVVAKLSVDGCSAGHKSVLKCLEMPKRQRVSDPDEQGWRTVGSGGGKRQRPEAVRHRGGLPHHRFHRWRPRTVRELLTSRSMLSLPLRVMGPLALRQHPRHAIRECSGNSPSIRSRRAAVTSARGPVFLTRGMRSTNT